MAEKPENNSPSQEVEEKAKDTRDSRHYRSMTFVSRYKNLRILDPKNLKRVDRLTGETVYGTEMVFKTVGNIGFYKPKSQREAAILLGCSQVQLQGASVSPKAPSDQVVGVVTAPLPENVLSGKP